jgi:hypothetical protein
MSAPMHVRQRGHYANATRRSEFEVHLAHIFPYPHQTKCTQATKVQIHTLEVKIRTTGNLQRAQ